MSTVEGWLMSIFSTGICRAVHREEYYLSAAEREQMKSGNNPNNCLGEADIIIAKQRNGPTGELKLHWFQQYTRFKNAERHEYGEFESYDAASEF